MEQPTSWGQLDDRVVARREQMPRPRAVEVLGVPVHDVDLQETIDLLTEFVESRRPHQVATVNPEFIMRASRDVEFLRILRQADLCLPDGIGVVWASRVLGRPLKTRVAGVDTVWRLMGIAAERRYRVFLLGARPGVAERTAEVLRASYSALNIVGTYAGSPVPEEDESTGKRIRDAQPDIVLVAYGAPAQDKWIYRNGRRLDIPLAMGVGGTFDFISGVSRRAPLWVQRIGLEWLYRLCREPWRWRRMLALPQFALRVMYARMKAGRTGAERP